MTKTLLCTLACVALALACASSTYAKESTTIKEPKTMNDFHAKLKNQRLVDARQFDIAGVKVGMDFEEARAAAAKYLNVPPSEIKPFFHMSPVYGESQIVRDIEAITGAKRHSGLVYEKDKVKLTISFEPRVPFDKARPLAVSEVEYGIPVSEENKAAMKEAAFDKYGEPTRWGGIMTWCAKVKQVSKDCSLSEDQAVLTYHGVRMNLADGSWQRAKDKYFQDLKDSKAKTKPNF